MNERMSALLRDVIRSGCVDRWSHLQSHGHSYSTVAAALRRGFLKEPKSYQYELTKAGLEALTKLKQ